MTDEIYVYLVDMPRKVHEMVVPCHLGYTIYIDCKLDKTGKEKAFKHALQHIMKNDFSKHDAGITEFYTHIED